MISCASNANTVVIVPDLYFPSFPVPEMVYLDKDGNEVVDEDTDIKSVLINYDFIKGELLDFKLEYDETRLYYFTIRNGYSSVVDRDNKAGR